MKGSRSRSSPGIRTAHVWIACILALAPGIGAPPALALNVFVQNTHPACSDTGPGSSDAPYCTINAALSQHHGPGDIIFVRPGVYKEQVVVPGSGDPGNRVVLQAVTQSNQEVVLDGADDFSQTALWAVVSGSVHRAASVTWSPLQVIVDGLRLTPSTNPPGLIPANTYQYVAGQGLYVNLGGGNPGARQTFVGRRNAGFVIDGHAWVTIDGFTIRRSEDRGISLTGGAHDIQISHNTVSLSWKSGIQAAACSTVRILTNVAADNADHGIALTQGTVESTVENNDSFGNAVPGVRSANGIYLFGASRNVVRNNRVHHNQDTGVHMQTDSNDNVSVQNVSWANGDHGFDHLYSSGNIHVGDVAYGNTRDGFSIEGDCTGHQLHNCIAMDNGLTTEPNNLWVDPNSTVGFVSNDNIFWSSDGAPPIKYIDTRYHLSEYQAASGQDARSIEADPRFLMAPAGDFHLEADSPAIDNANSGAPNWPTTDAQNRARVDDPARSNQGQGPMTFADRGALEYLPPGTQAPVAVGPEGRNAADSTQVRLLPNPVRGRARIDFVTTRPGPVQVRVFDLRGRLVRVLLDDPTLPAGSHSVALDAATLERNLYFFQIRSADGRRVGRFSVVR